jgi:hypothetical protein
VGILSNSLRTMLATSLPPSSRPVSCVMQCCVTALPPCSRHFLVGGSAVTNKGYWCTASLQLPCTAPVLLYELSTVCGRWVIRR